MSRFYYIASNVKLEELKNPYVKSYSVKEAIKAGMDVDIDALNDMVHLGEKNTILYCEDESKIGYPNIYQIKKRNYAMIVKTKMKYIYSVDTDVTDEYIEVVKGYISEQIEKSKEIELHSVYLDEENDTAAMEECNIDSITNEKLLNFFSSDKSELILKISK